MPYNIIPVEELRLELEKSNIISKDYARHLVDMALWAYQTGKKDGEMAAKGETLKEALTRNAKEFKEKEKKRGWYYDPDY